MCVCVRVCVCVCVCHASVDLKIRMTQLAQYNYILVVGKEEVTKGTVNVRTRDNVVHGEMELADLAARLAAEIAAYQ